MSLVKKKITSLLLDKIIVTLWFSLRSFFLLSKYRAKEDYKLNQNLISEFRAGLLRGELELYFQPQVDLSTQQILGVEALVRWNHPVNGLMLPNAFLHLIDNTPLGVLFGEWVIKTALQKLSKRDDGLTISINITPFHLQQDTFYSKLKRLLQQYPEANPELLKIELTETTHVSNYERLKSTMCKCSGLGVKFSLDDFGTGYSTLSQLRLLPVSQLKIDRSFIQAFDKNEQDRKMIHAIIMLATYYDIEVAAEGIESTDQGDELNRIGCTLGQGYFYAKPMPYSEFNRFAEKYSHGVKTSFTHSEKRAVFTI